MLLQDVRFALRSLRRSPGFAAVALLCLGLGIGVTGAIFSVIDGVILKPMPYAEPDRLVVPVGTNQAQDIDRSSISYLEYLDWKAQIASFAGMSGVQGRSLTLSDGTGEPQRFVGALVSWDLFQLLGVAPAMGAVFTAAHDQPGAEKVAILSHAVWQDRYQSDSQIIGRSILINAVPTVIIGVMPKDFEFPGTQKVWLPLGPAANRTSRDVRSVLVYARLAPGATIERAQTELSTVTASIARDHAATNEGWGASIFTLRKWSVPDDVTRVLWLMMAGVTLVLFIACSNVANLQLARASARRREISVRAALGAERRRIITQLLTESVVLSTLAIPLGIAVAELGSRLIASAIPRDQVPSYISWDVDYRSILFTVGIAIATAVVFGMFPAVQASRGELHADLKEGTRGNSVRRSLLRSSLVVAQVALAIVALVGALLFVKTFQNLDSYEVGFDTRPLMTMRFSMAGEAYETPDARGRRVEDVIARVERLPGITAAFASNLVPMGGGGGGGSIEVEGFQVDRGKEPGISFTGVTPGFYRTLGVTLVRGRDFTSAEGWSRSAVAVINQTMADRFWKNREPVGGRFRLVRSDDTNQWFTVIGVARDIKQDDIDPSGEPFPAAYVPYLYQQTLNTGLTLRVSSGDPAAVTSAVRAELRSADRNIPVFQVATMEQVRRLGFWQFALFGWIFGTIGSIALVLAGVGVYGVLSYAVAQRTSEIGVRMALGASQANVLKLVVKQGLGLASIGVMIGLVLSALAMPQAQSLLYEVSPFDPWVFSEVALFLMVVAFFASFIPARRATKVDPLTALRG